MLITETSYFDPQRPRLNWSNHACMIIHTLWVNRRSAPLARELSRTATVNIRT